VQSEVPTPAPASKNPAYAGIALLVAAVLVALFVLSQRMDSGAHHYDTAAANQDLVTLVTTTTTPAQAALKFTAADAHFRAAFPGTPKRSVESVKADDGKTYAMTVYEEATDDSYFAIGSMPLPSTASLDLEAMMDGTAYVMGARVGSRYAKTFRGNEAYEAVIAAGCACDLEKAFMMLVRSNDRVTFIFGGADTNSEARYVAFRDSVEFV
jgi:hypothetical protein